MELLLSKMHQVGRIEILFGCLKLTSKKLRFVEITGRFVLLNSVSPNQFNLSMDAINRSFLSLHL